MGSARYCCGSILTPPDFGLWWDQPGFIIIIVIKVMIKVIILIEVMVKVMIMIRGAGSQSQAHGPGHETRPPRP